MPTKPVVYKPRASLAKSLRSTIEAKYEPMYLAHKLVMRTEVLVATALVDFHLFDEDEMRDMSVANLEKQLCNSLTEDIQNPLNKAILHLRNKDYEQSIKYVMEALAYCRGLK